MTDWLKQGLIQHTQSKFNSPLYAILDPEHRICIVQDFQALNAQMCSEPQDPAQTQDEIREIAKARSTIFSRIDVTNRFGQLLLHPRTWLYTAFNLPGQGQYLWDVTTTTRPWLEPLPASSN